MSESHIIYKGKLKQVGIFVFKDFYNFVYDWLKEENYDVFEKHYKEIFEKNGKKIEVLWEAHKPISDYFEFSMTLQWRLLGIKDIEVQKEGKKEKMDSGTIEIIFKQVSLVKDFQNNWKSKFWKFFRNIYDSFIIRNRIEDYEIKLLEETDELISQCKAFLSLAAQHD
jgi:hypothetical protein